MKVIYDRVLNMLREGERASSGPSDDKPAFTSFQLTGVPLALEVGDALGPDVTFTWTTQNPGLVVPNTVEIEDATNHVSLADSLADDGSEAVTMPAAIVKNSPGYHQFSIKAQSLVDNSYFSRTTSQSWQQRIYYGESPSTVLDEAEIKALRVTGLQSSCAGTYSFNAGDYKYFAFATSQGTPQQFIDVATGFVVAMDAPFQVDITNNYGVVETYNVYRTYNQMGSAITIRVLT